MNPLPVGQPGQQAVGSFRVEASIDTGPIKGLVKQTIELNIEGDSDR